MTIIPLLRNGLLAAGALLMLAANAQERNPATIIRKVAAQVISNTAFRFMDPKTKQPVPEDSLAAHTGARTESRYNKWEYANGVLMIGMLQAAQTLNDTTYSNYVQRNFEFIFSHLPQFEKHYPQDPKTEWAAFFRMGSLDDCGAMAAALTDALAGTDKKAWRAYLQRAAEYIVQKQVKLKDGTLARPVPRLLTIWADDLYMSVPFLARMGRLTGQRQYFEEAVKQVLLFNKHLYDPGAELYYHCWYSDVEQHGVANWLRCNGWVAMAQTALLDHLPQNHPQRKKLIEMLLKQIIGFSRYQDKSGLWHQLINKPDSYLETSGTAMLVYTVARAVNQGWIDASYGSIAKDGWKGLTDKITPDGQVQDVCIGTGIGNNISFYYERPRVLNEFHALGAVLLAGAEMAKLK